MAYILALFVGLSLRLLGTGGAILGLPILIYIGGLSPTQAIPISLLTVGLVSLISLLTSRQYIQWSLLKYIVPASLLGIYTGIEVSKFSIFNENIRLLVFGVCAAIAGLLMIYNSNLNKSNCSNTRTSQQELSQNIILCLLIYSVTIIAGFIGIGGGFALIPILVLYKSLEYKIAATLSLFLICINSLTGFSLYYLQGINIPWSFTLIYILMALLGIVLGQYISNKLDCTQHKKLFGVFILCISLFTATQAILGLIQS